MTAISWVPPYRHFSANSTVEKITKILDSIFSNIATLDLTQTADTGQYVLGDVNAYGSLPASGGVLAYRLYRLDDALVAELPLYIKLEITATYGTGKATTGYALGSRVTVGTDTNGLGNISSNSLSATTQIGFANESTYAEGYSPPKQSFASTNVDKGFFGVIYNPGINSGDSYGANANFAQIGFFIERIPNADGTPSTMGYTLWGQTIIQQLSAAYNPNGNLSGVAMMRGQTRLLDTGTTIDNTFGAPYFPQTAMVGADLLVNHLYHSTPLPIRSTCLTAIRRGVIGSGSQFEINTYGTEMLNFVTVDAGEAGLRPTHYANTNPAFIFE